MSGEWADSGLEDAQIPIEIHFVVKPAGTLLGTVCTKLILVSGLAAW